MSLQVSIALISFLETMLLTYLSYKVRAVPSPALPSAGIDFSCPEPSGARRAPGGFCLGDVSASSGCFPFSFPLRLLDKPCAEQNLFFSCFLRNADLFKAGSVFSGSG